tara:strand:- start:23 stop:478 length:456 start_codon:yes stop_codon:yes gene_type:complete
MKLTEVITCLTEGTSGRGSSEGRKAYTSKSATKDDKKKSFKGRVKTYDSIKSALADGSYGQIFSTKAAGRLYVISKGKWGKKSGRGKIAKGFTPGSSTPSSKWSSVRKHASRTLLRYGKGSDKLAQKYGSRTIKAERGIGGKDGRADKRDK